MNRITKNILYGSIILVSIFCFLVVLIFNFGISVNIERTLSIASSISSLITLLIALALFNKFGVEQDILQKNLQAISEIFEILSKTRLSIKTNDGSWHFVTVSRDLREKRFSKDEHLAKYKNKIVAGSITVMSGVNELSTLGESIFMPKEIANRIREIGVASIIPSEDIIKKPDNYVIIEFHGVKKTSFDLGLGKEIEDLKPGLVNGKEITLNEYIKNFENLYTACQKWLKKNSSIDLDLNS